MGDGSFFGSDRFLGDRLNVFGACRDGSWNVRKKTGWRSWPRERAGTKFQSGMSHRKLCCWTCTKSPQILIIKMRVEQNNWTHIVMYVIPGGGFNVFLFVVFLPWNLGIIGSNLTGILFKWVELKSPTSYQFCSLVRLGWGKMWHYRTYTLEKSNMKHKNGGGWWWYAFSTG